MREIKKIILHCSDSDVKMHDDINIIKGWHQARGFKTVGYHFFVQKTGTVQKGRPLDEDGFLEPDEVGAHSLGDNFDSVGICMSGRKKFTHHQFRQTARLIEKLKKQCDLTNEDVYGHYETISGKEGKKTCPNIDMGVFRTVYLTPDVKKKTDGKGNSGSDKGTKQGSGNKPKRSDGTKPKGAKGTAKK